MIGIDKKAKLFLEGYSNLHVNIMDAWPDRKKCLEIVRNEEGPKASMRVVSPSTVITQDLIANRLTIKVDENNNIINMYWA